MKLLFINALKGLKKKKVQMLGIILMVMLASGIYTTMNTSLDRLENRFYNYLITQNVEDFSFVPVIDYNKDVTLKSLDKYLNKEFKDCSKEEKYLLNNYRKLLLNNSKVDEIISYQLNSIFDSYGVSEQIANKKINTITDKYDFSYEKEVSKVMNDDKYIIKAIPYNKDKKINKPYLIEGKMPTNKNEVVVLPKFASNNNLKLGDIYKIGNKNYKIVGYGYAPDHTYPMISFNIPIFDEKYNNIIFLNKEAYDEFEGIMDNVYVGKFNYKTDREDRLNMSMAVTKNDSKKENSDIEKIYEEEDIVTYNITTISRIIRNDMVPMELNTDRTFADTFLYLLLGIAVFIIVVITKKRIEDERLQIGVLKSLGYSSYKIATGYLVYPIIGSLIGGILGYLLGILFNPLLTTFYLNYFTIPLDGFKFNIDYLLVCTLIPIIVLSILSYFIAVFMLRKKPLDLLKEGSNLKINIFSRIVTKITKFLPFNYRFKYSLAFRSIGKLFIVSLTAFSTGMLIVLILIGMNLFNSMIDDTFDHYKFNYMVIYNNMMDEKDDTADLVFDMSSKIVKILDNKGKEKKLQEEDFSITLAGVDKKLEYMTITDSFGKDVTPILKNKRDVVINTSVKEIMKIDIGDTIIVNANSKEYKLNVVGIAEEYMSNNGYMNRKDLTNMLGIPLSYNKKYTNNSKYSSMGSLDKKELKSVNSIFSLEDLERNVRKQMETVNASIYIIIFFASFMALIIIAVIANIVVEENKKTISLMKVMGYKNKEISRIVLNIYTPFVIISYLLSIPFMIWLLKIIINSIVGDMNMAIPITLSPMMAIIGLISLLIGYFIAIALSRKVLNKVPLAVALKRE